MTTAGDPRGWGRMSTTKISGKINLWVVGLYVAYPSTDSNEGYQNLQKDIMKRGDAGGRMPISDGVMDPDKLFRDDMDKLMEDAAAARAEVLIYGDFNEKWSLSTPGAWRNWSTTHPLKNVLQSDSNSPSANATCFKNPAEPTDIDWLLATSRIASKKVGARAWISSTSVSGSVHRPVIFEFDASKFFALADSETIDTCRAPMKVSPLRGEVDGPFVTKFRELHDSLWEQSESQSLMDEINSSRFPSLPEETRQLKLEAGYRQVTDTFTAALKQLERLYSTGKSVKTYYSLEAVQIKKMISACEKWQLYWNRRLNEEKDTFGPNCLRGSSRNGHLGSAVSLAEMKKRAFSLASKLRADGCECVLKACARRRAFAFRASSSL